MFGAVMRLPFDTTRVGAEDQEVVGPIEIGHRDEREMPEHAKRGEHLRQLIGRARRIHVPRPQRPRERQRVGHQPEVVCDRIAVVHRHRVAPVRLADAHADRRPRDPARRPRRPRASASLRGSAARGCDRDRRGDRRARRPSGQTYPRLNGSSASPRIDRMLLTVGVDENAARRFAQRAGRNPRHAVILRAKRGNSDRRRPAGAWRRRPACGPRHSPRPRHRSRCARR